MVTYGIPYIGVTDFVNREQVELVKVCIHPHLNRRLHVGAMTSYKVQHGIPTRTGWEKIWLNEKGLHELFVDDKEVFNVIHYADYDKPSPTTVEDLLEALRRSGPYVNGIQLDMVWPSVEIVRQLHEQRPDISIILQVGKDALKKFESSDQKLLEEILLYEKFVEYFLIDFSVGEGIPLDPKRTIEYLDLFTKHISEQRFVVAGGLGPYTYELMSWVFKKFPYVSCDAQMKVKIANDRTSPMSVEKSCGYVEGICTLLLK